MKYKYLNDKNLDFLKRFLSTYSPSGYEMEAAVVWREYVSQFVPELVACAVVALTYVWKKNTLILYSPPSERPLRN